jgi:small nuclear ribonucleoprotein (snRNP)-like protein
MIGKRVILEKKSGAKFAGKLLSFQKEKNRVTLGNLTIINKSGGITSTTEKRYFSADSKIAPEIA